MFCSVELFLVSVSFFLTTRLQFALRKNTLKLRNLVLVQKIYLEFLLKISIMRSNEPKKEGFIKYQFVGLFWPNSPQTLT